MRFISRCGLIALIVVLIPLQHTLAGSPAQTALPRVNLILWHQQGEITMRNLGIQQIFEAWAKVNAPGSTLTLVQKDADDLNLEFTGNSLSAKPDFLWATADHVADFVRGGLLLPVTDLADASLFTSTLIDSVRVNGTFYGLPLQSGNFLMLYYNEK